MAISDLLRRLRGLNLTYPEGEPEDVDPLTVAPRAPPLRPYEDADHHLYTPYYRNSDDYRSHVPHTSLHVPPPEDETIAQATAGIIALDDSLIVGHRGSNTRRHEDVNRVYEENQELREQNRLLVEAMDIKHEELIHARMREIIHVDALTRIAFPESFGLTNLQGDPQRWSTTVAYTALGCSIVGGRTHTKETIPTSAHNARLAVRRLRNILLDIQGGANRVNRPEFIDSIAEVLGRIITPPSLVPNLPSEDHS